MKYDLLEYKFCSEECHSNPKCAIRTGLQELRLFPYRLNSGFSEDTIKRVFDSLRKRRGVVKVTNPDTIDYVDNVPAIIFSCRRGRRGGVVFAGNE